MLKVISSCGQLNAIKSAESKCGGPHVPRNGSDIRWLLQQQLCPIIKKEAITLNPKSH